MTISGLFLKKKKEKIVMIRTKLAKKNPTGVRSQPPGAMKYLVLK